ncbi:cupin domain-containing protein [Patescibacteria group bacterium]|nr:cupin domain-containing protein [Patescibacteria group bacterium]MBU2036325.1 cupin domain-containing protein [Patescibacteria group bacterium]
MIGYVGKIEETTEQNSFFRQVIYTGQHVQLVVMCLKPGEDIGMEVHESVDQFFRIEEGEGKVIMDGEETVFDEGFGIIISAGTQHNVVNTSQTEDLKLYTIYSPPNHPEGTVHKTKEEAMKAEEEEHNH